MAERKTLTLEVVGSIPTSPTTTPYGLHKAVQWAKKSDIRFRIGAWSHGWGACNSRKGHPALRHYGYPEYANRHAEMALAITALTWKRDELQGDTVYVARLQQDGSWGLARPCSYCAHMLADLGVRRVVFTTDPGGWCEYKF